MFNDETFCKLLNASKDFMLLNFHDNLYSIDPYEFYYDSCILNMLNYTFIITTYQYIVKYHTFCPNASPIVSFIGMHQQSRLQHQALCYQLLIFFHFPLAGLLPENMQKPKAVKKKNQLEYRI